MMKKLSFLLFIAGLFFLPGCDEYVDEYVTYQINEPVFMSASEFRSSGKVEEAQPVQKKGKIAFFNDYLYISQPEKGIHIIDNSNPKSPKNVAFIELVGNADMHIRNNMLYADSFVDLVWFDISDPAKPVLKGRKEEVFPEAFPSTGNPYGYDYQKVMERKNGIVVGWKLTEKKEKVTKYRPGWGGWFGNEKYYDSAPNTGSAGSGVGKTGSMSRFAIYKDNLYTVMNNVMGIFDLSGETPVKIDKNIYVGFNVETIFSYKEYMFLGTPTGMIVYSVENPNSPEYQSRVVHILGCDPVVVENDIAYVTVHSGDFCGQDVDQLMIIDVKDVKKPFPIVTYTMTRPMGLGIDNNTLFVCDDGLKVFNATDPLTIMTNENRLAHFKNVNGFDVIPLGNVLMMIAEDGIYQYDYSDVKDIKLLSKLPIGK